MFEQHCPMKMDKCCRSPRAPKDIHKDNPSKEAMEKIISRKRPKYDYKNAFQCTGQVSYYD